MGTNPINCDPSSMGQMARLFATRLRTGQQGTTRPSTDAADSTINRRNLVRAERDRDVMLRGAARETGRLLDQAGDNPDATDKIKTMAADFESLIAKQYDEFVGSGAGDYLSFAQSLAVARRDLRANLRGIAEGLPAQTQPQPNAAPAEPTNAAQVRRATRDVDALNRGVEREFGHIARHLDGNDKALESLGALRTDFAAQVDKEFKAFEESGSTDYLSFAERLASMRMSLQSGIRGIVDGVRSGGTDGPAIAAEPPAPQPRPAAADTNLDRAKRDMGLLLDGLQRDTDRYSSALAGTDRSGRIGELAGSFRELVETRYDEFVRRGGTDYLGFASELASARLGLASQFRALAGPKVDIRG